jgi:hypothetical protein
MFQQQQGIRNLPRGAARVQPLLQGEHLVVSGIASEIADLQLTHVIRLRIETQKPVTPPVRGDRS